MMQAQARLATFVEQAARTHMDAAIAVVGHADPLRALLCFLLGMPIDFYDRIELEPATVAVVAIDPWRVRMSALQPSPA